MLQGNVMIGPSSSNSETTERKSVNSETTEQKSRVQNAATVNMNTEKKAHVVKKPEERSVSRGRLISGEVQFIPQQC